MTKMIEVKPVFKGNVARSVNPAGCHQEILNQIKYVEAKGRYEGPKKVLILGASSSYGLATRITTAFGARADTIGVSFERGPKDEEKLGSAGWYNNIYFRQEAEKKGLIAKNFIGDAFSNAMKEQVIDYIKTEFGGKIDLLVYSLASPKRIDPNEPEKVYTSVIKPIGQSVSGKNINLETETLDDVTIEPANNQEIADTIKVMGGEDWEFWIDALKAADVLANGFKTTLYSYIGTDVTDAFYHSGTLGQAKTDAEKHAHAIQNKIDAIQGQSVICVSKAVTTKASLVIPKLSIYCLALYKVMLDKGTHETPIMHKDRVYRDMLYGNTPSIDAEGRLRPDSWERDFDTQEKTKALMAQITPENFKSGRFGYQTLRHEFMNLNGFDVDGAGNQTIDFDEIIKLKP